MTERKRLECRNFGNCLWNGEHNYGCDGHLPEWDGERHDCEEYEPMPDAKSLLELADEFDAQGDYIARVIEDSDGDFDRHAIDVMEERYGYARRIREACGVRA